MRKWIVVFVVVILVFTGTFILLNNQAKLTVSLGLPFPAVTDTIIVQPFEGMPVFLVNAVYNELKISYRQVKLAPPIPIPAFAYYASRKRYRADTLISWLSRRGHDNTITIGLIEQDISTTKGGIADWGVMGLGYQPGKSCIVSTFRLQKTDLKNQLCKVAIHELGHTFGLPHCTVINCFMRDAEGQNHLSEENGFCTSCIAKMRSYGWK